MLTLLADFAWVEKCTVDDLRDYLENANPLVDQTVLYLSLAAQQGRVDLIELLLDRGIPVDGV